MFGIKILRPKLKEISGPRSTAKLIQVFGAWPGRAICNHGRFLFSFLFAERRYVGELVYDLYHEYSLNNNPRHSVILVSVAPKSQRAPEDDQPSLPFLVHRIASRLEQQINRVAKGDGLKIEAIRILLRLLRGGDQRVGHLANATSIEQSALSHMLKRMEANALITRGKIEKHDSRTALVSLTLRGRRMAQKYAPLFKSTDEAWMDGLSLPDRRRLKQMLNNIYERISVDPAERESDAEAAH